VIVDALPEQLGSATLPFLEGVDPAWMVAERTGISEQTVWQWRSRDTVRDRIHRPPSPQHRVAAG
jgi:hypothetical protein